MRSSWDISEGSLKLRIKELFCPSQWDNLTVCGKLCIEEELVLYWLVLNRFWESDKN